MERPIGVIDSGVGGLTVAKELMRQLPKEEIYYLGDTLRCPYGPRPKEQVRTFTWQMVHYLLEHDIKMLVIACNTATAVVLDEIKERLSIPVVGVVHPGARTALKITDTNQVAVIGTEGTIRSGAYEDALKSINGEAQVTQLACPKFVPLVENGELDSEEMRNVVKESLAPLQDQPFDSLILGCTHYPLIEHVIKEEIGDNVQTICSGDETAREVSTLLYHQNLLYTGDRIPNHHYFTTGTKDIFMHIANRWLDNGVKHVHEIILDE